MRIYHKSFGSEFGDVASMLIWIESCLPHTHYIRNLDEIGIVVCECAHNIIEHHIKRVSKMQLYTNQPVFPKYQVCIKNTAFFKKTYSVFCTLLVKPTQILITFNFPFKPCYKGCIKVKNLGGRGKRIMTLFSAKTRSHIHYGISRGVITLRIPCKYFHS